MASKILNRLYFVKGFPMVFLNILCSFFILFSTVEKLGAMDVDVVQGQDGNVPHELKYIARAQTFSGSIVTQITPFGHNDVLIGMFQKNCNEKIRRYSLKSLLAHDSNPEITFAVNNDLELGENDYPSITTLQCFDEQYIVTRFYGSLVKVERNNKTKKYPGVFIRIYNSKSDDYLSEFYSKYYEDVRAHGHIEYYTDEKILVFSGSKTVLTDLTYEPFIKLEEGKFRKLSNNRFATRCRLSDPNRYAVKIYSLDMKNKIASQLALLETHEYPYDSYHGYIIDIIEIDGNRIAYCMEDGTIKIYSLDDYSCCATLIHPINKNEIPMYAEDYMPPSLSLKKLPNNRMASIGADNSVKVWDLSKFECVLTDKFNTCGTWEEPAKGEFNGDSIVHVAGLANDLFLLFFEDSSVHVYDLNSGKRIHTIAPYVNYDPKSADDSKIRNVIQVNEKSFISWGSKQSPSKIMTYVFDTNS